MSAETELRKAVLNFIKNHHESSGKAPSIRAICREVNDVSVNKFYKLFPEGLGEVCKKAGIPTPIERIKATRNAVKSQEMKAPIVENPRAGLSPTIALSEMQNSRLQGISHLEGGKDPIIIIDELLERDTYLRKTKELSLDDTKDVFDYLEGAKKRGWRIPWLLDIQAKLWNAGLKSMSSEAVQELVGFLEGTRKREWEAVELVEFLSKPIVKHTLPKLSPEEGERVTFLLREVDLKGLTVSEYLNQIDEVRRAMAWHQAYMDGRVTYEQFKKEVNLQ